MLITRQWRDAGVSVEKYEVRYFADAARARRRYTAGQRATRTSCEHRALMDSMRRMDDIADNRPPRRRLVPLIGALRDDGRLIRYDMVELLPHPLDLVDVGPAAED